MSMFSMYGTYEERKIANDIVNGATIDTARVTDASHPFETGIKSPNFNGNNWVIVEEYDTLEEAKIGHARWVATFTADIPASLVDVSTSFTATLKSDACGNDWRTKDLNKNDDL